MRSLFYLAFCLFGVGCVTPQQAPQTTHKHPYVFLLYETEVTLQGFGIELKKESHYSNITWDSIQEPKGTVLFNGRLTSKQLNGSTLTVSINVKGQEIKSVFKPEDLPQGHIKIHIDKGYNVTLHPYTIPDAPNDQ